MREKRVKLGCSGSQKPLAMDERQSFKPPVFDGVSWANVVGNVQRLVDVAVWEAEGTKEMHLFL